MSPVGPMDPATTTSSVRTIGDLARELCGNARELRDPTLNAMRRETEPIGTEGVGEDDVAARFDELLMQLADADPGARCTTIRHMLHVPVQD